MITSTLTSVLIYVSCTCLILLVMTDGSLALSGSVSLKVAGKPLRYAKDCMRISPGASLSVVCKTHNNKRKWYCSLKTPSDVGWLWSVFEGCIIYMYKEDRRIQRGFVLNHADFHTAKTHQVTSGHRELVVFFSHICIGFISCQKDNE